MPMIYLEKVILKDNFDSVMENLYQMIKSFAKWLYSTPPTCKEGNGIQCTALSAEYRGTGVGLAQGPSGP